jgi:asparagine synthase (glutamine-hydrolysing)
MGGRVADAGATGGSGVCGIAGVWCFGAATEGDIRARVVAMSDTLERRGPDASGMWVDSRVGLGLGHRRLSILDLSSAANQPMIHDSYVITYNGEIYNFVELRRRLALEGAVFRTQSDTEVILAAVARWGIAATLPRLRGMFAFAMWDAKRRTLALARDPLGIKPLYYGWNGKDFVFASELKAISEAPGFSRELNREAMADFIGKSYVPAPQSVFRDIYKLRPGRVVTINERGEWREEIFFDATAAASSPSQRGSDGRLADEAVEDLHDAIADAVRCHTVADVPIGTFLSGGIDSTLVTCLMQSTSARPVRTFAAGFEDEDFDEAGKAREIAKHLGTDHHEITVSAQAMLAEVPTLPLVYDEPFGDSSQIPTCLLAKFARKHVTVVLSGDGGDELFCGYDRYVRTWQAWHLVRWLPLWMRRAGRIVMSQALQAGRRDAPMGRQARLLSLLDADGFEMVYERLTTNRLPDVLLDEEPRVVPEPSRHAMRTVEDLMLRDLSTYLPDDILTKVDRASMTVGLEVRVPLLDLEVVARALRIPLDYKWRAGEQKWILKRILERYLPRKLFVHPKHGFRVPLASWLRGPLRDWAEDLITEPALSQHGLFDGAAVRRVWRAHLDGVRGLHHALWDILMLQAWLREWRCYS